MKRRNAIFRRSSKFCRPSLLALEDRCLPGSLLSYAFALAPPVADLLFAAPPALLVNAEPASTVRVTSVRGESADSRNSLATHEQTGFVPTMTSAANARSPSTNSASSVPEPFTTNGSTNISLLDADLLTLLARPSARLPQQISLRAATSSDGALSGANPSAPSVENAAGGSGGTAATVGIESRRGTPTSRPAPQSVPKPGGGSQFTLLTDPTVASVVFLPRGQGTTGDLDPNNPNGTGGTPAFGGGSRFFPDAENFATRNVSRNIVRIRATVAPAMAGVAVHFRSFDVDDPSTDAAIDLNGANGRDNLGIATGANLDVPATVGMANGYRGRLRPVGGNFAAEGSTISVQTVLNAQGEAIAEAELATSFNPGDNFRIVASTVQQEVQGLNDDTGVPTTGAVPNFSGVASEQLSIWRRFHIEQDRMDVIPFGQRQTGAITNVVVVPFGAQPPTQALVTFNFQIGLANGFRGGNMRDANGNQYPVVTHTTGNPSTALVRVLDGILPAQGAVELTQGDFQQGQIVASNVPAGGQLELTTNIHLTRWNEYAGGVLRTNGQNYSILSNTQGANGRVTINSGSLTELPPGPVEIYQDDYVSLGIGDQPPVPRIAQPADTTFYDFLQVSTVRSLNRYADAYLEPEYNALNEYDSPNVTPVGHFPDVGNQYGEVADPYRGTSPGTPARPADYETRVFWVVYVLAGYEETHPFDYDGTIDQAGLQQEGATLGATNALPGQVAAGGEVSVIFTEVLRDVAGVLSEAEVKARSVVHEIGHQFDVAQGAGADDGEHRNNPPNIMSSHTGGVPAAQFYFHPTDIRYLRQRVHSPGTHPAF